MMLSRRSFLQQASAGALALTIPPLPLSKGLKQDWGLILNTVKNEMKADYVRTLERIAEMGYKYVEGNYHGKSRKEYARLLKSLGLKGVAGGSSMKPMLENIDDYIKTAEALEFDYIICYWPWLSSAKQLTQEECLEAAENLNQLGKRIKEAGFRLAWHNHDKEFIDMEGHTPFDILLKNTDPDLVAVEMDLYWVRKGNADPVSFIKKYPGRIELFHVKDMDNSEDQGITCVGQGNIDFEAIFEYGDLAGVRYPIVENERSTAGITCAQVSIDHLNKIRKK